MTSLWKPSRLSITYTADVTLKLRIYQNKKWADKQIKTIIMDKRSQETAYLQVEIMNSKWQVKGKLGHVARIRVYRYMLQMWCLTSQMKQWLTLQIIIFQNGFVNAVNKISETA